MSNHQSTSLRLIEIHSANTIFYWSIRHQKLFMASETDFPSLNNTVDCPICIPVYRFRVKERKNCDWFHVTCFARLKAHILHCETIWRRPMIWVSKNEIPSNLIREREIGDLTTLKDNQILKINFATKTVIFCREFALAYFKRYGCHCRDGTELDCDVTVMGSSYFHFFSHVSHIEKRLKKLILFKADSQELFDGEKLVPVVVRSNDSSPVQYITEKLLKTRKRQKRCDEREGLPDISTNSSLSDSTFDPLSNRYINLTKNGKKRGRPFKYQSTDQLPVTTNSHNSTLINHTNDQQSNHNSTIENELNSSDQSIDIPCDSLMCTVYYCNGQWLSTEEVRNINYEMESKKPIELTNQIDPSKHMVIDGFLFEMLDNGESDSDNEINVKSADQTQNSEMIKHSISQNT